MTYKESVLKLISNQEIYKQLSDDQKEYIKEMLEIWKINVKDYIND